MASKRKRVLLTVRDGVTIMDLGSMDIWDGADLALIRDTLTALYFDEGLRRIGIDMASVKFVPSGFFGMLFDWKERGIEMFLVDPQPSVRRMLWFRQFAEPAPLETYRRGVYRLTEEVQEEMTQHGVGHWEDPLDEQEYAVATGYRS